MFTLQTNSISSALRNSPMPEASAQDMVNAMCNAVQPISHQGPVAYSYLPPGSGLYPALTPPPGSVEFVRDPQTPTADYPVPQPPSGDTAPREDGPSEVKGARRRIGPYGDSQPGVDVSGPLYAGPICCGPVTAKGVFNRGPTKNHGKVVNKKDTRIEGTLTVNNDAALGDVVTKDARHEGNVLVMGECVHVGPVINQGPMFQGGPLIIGGPVHVNIAGRAGNVRPTVINYIAAVTFNSTANQLIAERRRACVLALWDNRQQPQVIAETESCE
jgi:hypothetical protein